MTTLLQEPFELMTLITQLEAMPTPVLQPRLPPELQEHIIDLLGRAKEDLLAASLVCKHWRYRSYAYIFLSITLNSCSVDAFGSFLDISFSRSVIFSRVRRVRILGVGGRFPAVPWTAFRRKTLHAILSYLVSEQRMSCLVMEDINWSHLDTEVILTLAELGPMVASIELQNVYFPDIRSYCDFIGAFESLRTFGFRNIECAHGEVVLSQTQGSFNSSDPASDPEQRTTVLLKPPEQFIQARIDCSLTLRNCERGLEKKLSCLFSDSLSREASWEITRLGTQTSLVAGHAPSLLKSLGPFLKRLQIISQHNVLSDRTITALDISSNTSLQYLSFYSPDRVFGMISWLHPILRQITGYSLRILEVAFASSRQFHLDQRLLRFVGRELERPQFSQLKIIHFWVNRMHSRYDVALENNIVKYVKETLSNWSEKGVLRFTFTEL
ncbi:hypothetical protein VKT23_016105 [Stygiomarasmius scandens]|uniref:F-box domain-containing protein n=1 Tax=Marasmiellus scandens TaxID=2682957 RepID=A0ABR1IVZ3_9AGAR